MDADFAKRWVADLRDPANIQCRSKLHDGVGYCCLGRAAVLAGAKLVPMSQDYYGNEDKDYIKTDNTTFVIDGTQHASELFPDERVEGEYEELDDSFCDQIDLSYTDGKRLDRARIEIAGRSFASLADANDRGCTFAQIADWIEANYEVL